MNVRSEPKRPDPGEANEMVYLDENGDRQDAELHEELLGGTAEEETSREAYDAALESGMDHELADRLYG